MKLYIHCGPPRTGTTSFQNLLMDMGQKFSNVIVPRAGWDPHSFGVAHHDLLKYDNDSRSISLGEFNISSEPFAEFVASLEANKDLPVNVVISTERFASFIWRQIDLLHKELYPYECYFVFGARNLLDLHLSIWRKRVELGWRIGLDQSVKTIFSELMYMYTFFPKLIERKFGRNAIRMVPYTSSHRDNLVNLATACGMNTLVTDPEFLSLVNDQPILSESLSYQETELLRQANEIICKELGTSDEWVPSAVITQRDEVAKSLSGVSLDVISTSLEVQRKQLRELYQACRPPYFPDEV